MNARRTPSNARFDWSTVPLFGWVETSVLEYFRPTFVSVHVLLHSFVKPKPEWANRFSWPGPEKDQEIVDGSDPVTWSQVAAWAGFSSWREVDLVLRRNQILGDGQEVRRLLEVVDRLSGPYDEVMEERGLYEPPEGDLSPHTRVQLLRALKSCGHESILVWDGYAEERHRLTIDEALAGIDGPSPLAMYTEDRLGARGGRCGKRDRGRESGKECHTRDLHASKSLDFGPDRPVWGWHGC